jgi:hypothetical protein
MSRQLLRTTWIVGPLALALSAPLTAQNGLVTQRVPCERLPGAACHELSIDLARAASGRTSPSSSSAPST